MLFDRFLHRQALLKAFADAIDHAGLTIGKVDELIARGPGDDGPQDRRVFCPSFVEPVGLKERVHFSGRKVLEGAVVFQEGAEERADGVGVPPKLAEGALGAPAAVGSVKDQC